MVASADASKGSSGRENASKGPLRAGGVRTGRRAGNGGVTDFDKFGRPELLHLAFLALDDYRKAHGALPQVYPAAADAAGAQRSPAHVAHCFRCTTLLLLMKW